MLKLSFFPALSGSALFNQQRRTLEPAAAVRPAARRQTYLGLMRRLDQLHLEHPVFGGRKLTTLWRRQGVWINRKRLVRVMGIETIYSKSKLSEPEFGHQVLPVSIAGFRSNGAGPGMVFGYHVNYRMTADRKSPS
jgi:hypothetical protein